MLIDQGTLTKEDIKKIQTELRKIRKKINVLKNNLLEKLDSELEKLTIKDCNKLTLELFNDEIQNQLSQYFQKNREQLINEIINLWNKYKITKKEIIESRNFSENEMNQNLKTLGFKID